MQAGQDILARFANNATLVSGRDVLLEQEALNCEIVAEGRVLVGGQTPSKGGIIGGTVRAAQSLLTYNIGSAGARTRAQVGYDWLAPVKFASIDAELAQLQQQAADVKAGVQALLEARAKGPLNTEQRMRFEQLRLQAEPIQRSIRELNTHRDRWVQAAQSKGSISVFGTAHAGAELVLDGKLKRLTETTRQQRYVNEGGVVVGNALP